MIFSAHIKDGKPAFHPKDKETLDNFLRSMEGKKLWFNIDDTKPPRSNKQNKRYWAILSFIADEIGDDSESIHECDEIKKLLPKVWTVDEDGREVELEKSTTRLTTKEFCLYNDRVIVWAATFHGITVPPDPNEQ